MTFNAFEISPVPTPGPDAVAPEPYHGIYGMPMLVTVPCADLAASARFWCDVLGFFELFAIPGALVHLRRWAFQDVLLVPGSPAPGSMSVSFACVLTQLDGLADAARAAGADVDGPRDTPWGTRDLTITTPEGTRVVMTAARPWDATSEEAANLARVGIEHPGE